MIERHQPVILNHGPWADHDHTCPACQDEPSVLDLSVGRFQPGWKCQTEGWRLIRRPRWFPSRLWNRLAEERR